MPYHIDRIGERSMENEDIPALIKTLTTRMALTQEQFAHQIGVTCSTVNNWENGKRTPLPFLVKRLHEIRDDMDSQGRRHSRKKVNNASKRGPAR